MTKEIVNIKLEAIRYCLNGLLEDAPKSFSRKEKKILTQMKEDITRMSFASIVWRVSK